MMAEPDKHVSYTLVVGFTDGNGIPFEWIVQRRYKQFTFLEAYLSANAAFIDRVKLPGKGLLSSDESKAPKRLPVLAEYIKRLVSHRCLFELFEVQHFFGIIAQLKHLYPHAVAPPLPARIATAQTPMADAAGQDGVVYLKLLEARGLPTLRPGKVPTTYATLHLSKGVLQSNPTPPSVRTENFESSLDPQWNVESMFFSKKRTYPIRIHLWEVRHLSANKTLGFAELELPRMQPHRLYDVWLPLAGPAADCGQVHVQAQVTPMLVDKPKINKLPNFRFQLHQTDFFPGQVVAGLLVLNVGQPITATRISISLIGYQQTHWTESHHEHYQDAHGRSQTRHRTVHHGQTWAILNEQRLVWRRSHGVEAIGSGSYIWPFEFYLPQRLPASFESTHAWCRYAVKATIHRPGLRFNQRLQSPIRMLAPYVSLSPLPPSFGKCEKLPFRSGDQVVFLQVTMPHSITIIGETTRMSLLVDNHTRHRVLDAKVTLNRTVVARAGSHTKVETTSLCLAHVREGFPVAPNESRQLLIDLPVPATTQPSLPEDISPLIQVTYTLIVCCDISGFLTGQSTAEVPLILSMRIPQPTLLYAAAAAPSSPVYPAQEMTAPAILPPPAYAESPPPQQAQLETAFEAGSTAFGLPRFGPESFAPLPDLGSASSTPEATAPDEDDEFKPENATPMFTAPPPPVSVFFPGLDYAPYRNN